MDQLKKAQILVAGYFGAGNLGDEAILASIIQDFSAALPAVEIQVISEDPDRTQREHGRSAIHRTDIPRLIDCVARSDLVLMAGGLFHDYWTPEVGTLLTRDQSGLAYYSSVPYLAWLTGTPCMLYGVGVGPLQSETAQSLVQLALQSSDVVTVRDPASLTWVEGARRSTAQLDQEVQLTADPAFRLTLAPPSLPIEVRQMSRPILGVNLRHWDMHNAPPDWELAVAEALNRFLETSQGSAILIPFQHETGGAYVDDRIPMLRLREYVDQPDRVIYPESPANWEESAAIMAGCDLVLAMRLHAALFALRAGVASVGLSYDPKVRSLFELFGFEDLVLDPSDWSASAIYELVERAATSFPAERSREVEAQLRKRAGINLSQALDLLRSGRRQIEPDAQFRRRDLLNRFKREFAMGQKMEQLETALDRSSRMQSELEAGIRSMQQDRQKLLEQLEAGEAEKAQIRAEQESLRIERDETARQLSGLQETIGVRLLGWYWERMKRLLPPGSRRRLLYHRFRRQIAKMNGAPKRLFALHVSASSNGMDSRRSEAHQLSASLRMFQEQLVDLQRQELEGIFLITAPTGMESSEGQRSFHLARELARMNYGVVFAYWRWESGPEWRIGRDSDDRIIGLPLDVLLQDPSRVIRQVRSRPSFLLSEFPYPGLFGLLALADGSGWITIYDLIDDWEGFHRVGQAPWYEPAFEAYMSRSSDHVVAVSESLASRAVSLGAENVKLVPNGLDPALAKSSEIEPLARGDLTLGYFGYLSSAWFDWDLVCEVAARRPAWMIYLIGYGEAKARRNLPANVIHLGRQPRERLAAFARNWDVAIAPFKRGPVAHHADPIKLYEYFGLGLPVVATGVRAPVGAAGLMTMADGADSFIAQVEQAAMPDRARQARRRAYALANTWESRARTLVQHLRSIGPEKSMKQALFGLEA